MIPPLRSDLELVPAPTAADGSPQYTLYDPVSETYHRFGWAEGQVLAGWRAGMTAAELASSVRARSTLAVTEEDVAGFVALVEAHGFTTPWPTRSGTRLAAEAERRRIGPFAWLVHHYIYIRIPLVSPDRFLDRTLPLARALAGAPMLLVYLSAALLGAWLLAARWEDYLHTFPSFLTPAGAMAYGLTIVGVKTIHEFSHAYVAKSRGVRVRTMGLVLIVFWPIPYTDVTDAWRLPDRTGRFAIGIAGVAAELVLAGIALLGWALSPPGLARSVFFLVSSVTLVSTLVANLNPGMRFDGYYVLSDLWGIENLQSRAFALTRWALRKAFLGLDLPAPEEVGARRLAGLMVYTAYAWANRLVVYFAIALVVYHAFTKALGILLFTVEVGFFILRPLVQEVFVLARIRRAIRPRVRLAATVLVLAAGLGWLALPAPRTVRVPAVTESIAVQTVYAPANGFLEGGGFRPGDRVEAGRVLFEIRSPDLDASLEVLARRIAGLEARERIALAREASRAALPEIQEALAKARAETREAEERRAQSVVRAAFAGTVVEWDPERREGQAVGRDAVLGRIADPDRVRLVAYASEEDLPSMGPGRAVRFHPSSGGPTLGAIVEAVRPSRVEVLAHRAVASVAGGDVLVEDRLGRLVAMETRYEVELSLAHPPPGLPLGQSGRVVLESEPRSLLTDVLRRARNVLLRESDF